MTTVELDVEGQPEPAGPRTRLISTLVPLLVGASALVNSFSLGVGTLTAPSAGLWPAVASGIMIVAAIVLLFGWRRAAGERLREPPGVRSDGAERFDRGTVHIGLGVASLGVFVVLIGGITSLGWPGVGFEWATLALLVFWLKVIGKEPWRVTILVALGVTVALHLFFIELFQAPLPHTIGW